MAVEHLQSRLCNCIKIVGCSDHWFQCHWYDSFHQQARKNSNVRIMVYSYHWNCSVHLMLPLVWGCTQHKIRFIVIDTAVMLLSKTKYQCSSLLDTHICGYCASQYGPLMACKHSERALNSDSQPQIIKDMNLLLRKALLPSKHNPAGANILCKHQQLPLSHFGNKVIAWNAGPSEVDPGWMIDTSRILPCTSLTTEW